MAKKLIFEKKKEQQFNIYGTALKVCSMEPLTGFFRDGCCNTDISDFGSHTVCAEMTEEFLKFSKQQGNDLTTPRPEFGFDGLKSGDRWCLCAARWLEAMREGCAPQVVLEATSEKALDVVPFEILKQYSA